MKNLFSITTLVLMLITTAFAQSSFNYNLSLVPSSVSGLPGLHSYAHAQYQGKWLIIGGRLDGLHARQPFNAFPAAQNNTDIYVVDIANSQIASASVNNLPIGLKEQLQSTNMNFHQDGDTLYIIGGYGFSTSSNDHITYPYLSTIDVPGLITAIENSQSITPYFKQVQDNQFAVTGAHLEKLDSVFYLVGGHRFDGRYNPMGHATYTQTYTNQIRKFTINNSGSQLSYTSLTPITDPVHLRRRDYNLLPQIFPNGEDGFTISSGVFQQSADLPFLYPVDITKNGHTPITSFNQYLSNYHSAVANMYDSNSKDMHSIFFGGMSQYYYQNDTLIQDNLVPFVNTISRLTRDSNNTFTEYQMPVMMPGLKGASAEFIPNLNLAHTTSNIIKLSDINQNSFMIGHVFGGINSSSQNPFSANQTNLTNADNNIYEVWLTVSQVAVDEYVINGKNPYSISVFPNPFHNEFTLQFELDKPTTVDYIITDTSGKILKMSESTQYNTGENNIDVDLNYSETQQLHITVIFDHKYYVTKRLIGK